MGRGLCNPPSKGYIYIEDHNMLHNSHYYRNNMVTRGQLTTEIKMLLTTNFFRNIVFTTIFLKTSKLVCSTI